MFSENTVHMYISVFKITYYSRIVLINRIRIRFFLMYSQIIKNRKKTITIRENEQSRVIEIAINRV